tara:strand:+ start:16017 stop:20612 length:4596 start_codon:yes stop_codon:yes gene_type:complete
MPTKTPNLGLEAFVAGDFYSAAVDKRRFTTIDKHMAFISDIIGAGCVNGWVITQPNPPALNIEVSAGMGMIDKNITRTFGVYSKTVLDDNFVYVWMRRRPGVIGEFGAFADMVSYDHDDTSGPALASQLSAEGITISSLRLTWVALSDFDFAKYQIQRKLGSSEWVTIAEIETASTFSYLDSSLEDNTTYGYRYRAIDKTGNASSWSDTLEVTTSPDLSPPSDPTSVEVIPATNAIHLRWRPAPIGDIDQYKIETTPVSLENNPVGDTIINTVNGDQLYETVGGLTNTQKYRLIIKSVSDTGVESPGIVLYAIPDLFRGPKDVEFLEITDIESDGIVSDVIMRIDWESVDDPYDNSPPAASHEIRLEEFDPSNSSLIQSIWIEVPDDNFREFRIFQYVNSNGQTISKSITPRTQYFITIRAIDEDGNRSVGKIATHTTRSFEPPRPPSRFDVEQQDDQSLLASWFNSTSIFTNNVITVQITDIDNPSSVELVEDETRIGRADTYILNQSYIRPNSIYTFYLYCEDEFGNKSNELDLEFIISDFEDLPRPAAPSQVIGVAGNKSTTLTWNKPNLLFISNFRIYRASEQVVYEASDFTRVETVPGDVFTFTDYEVENDTSYVYFVTTLDIYGRESLNPIDDDFFDYKLAFLTPRASGNLGIPTNLTATLDGDSTGLDLSWEPTGGQFDGYEIYRSFNNKYSFTKIDSVPPSTTTYNDNDALIQDGIYYYMVRQFRNEADLFVTESNTAVAGGLFLGTVETSGGEATIDQTGLRRIADLEDPVRERARAIIAVHKHEYVTEVDDRRINLADTLTVSNWTTTDFQNYFTTSDLTSTTSFRVFLNGTPAGDFQLLFNLDKAEGRITFETRLAAGGLLVDEGDDFPFEEPPAVSIVFDGLTETQSTLPQERLENVSAQQISVGLVEERQLPNKDHDGRRREPLIPVQIDCIALDNGFRFAPIEEGVKVGEAVTWYDVFLAEGQEGDVLIAGTSDGIYKSDDFGISWERQIVSSTPVNKFFYAADIDLYFALTNRGIYGSGGGQQGGFSVWTEIRGTENNKANRGIVQDADGNIFCSGDLGVFKLQRDVGRQFFFWEQTPIFGPRSTESYAMLYDAFRDRVMVSNELGIFETSNAGIRWDFSEEMPDQRPIWDFYQEGDTIFAVTDFIVWRRKATDTEFQRIAVLQDVEMTRKVRYWKDRLFITTDLGCYVSIPEDDPLNDTTIEFELAFPQMNRNSYVPPPSSMNIIDNKLFVGTEERLFSATAPGRMALQSEIVLGVIPTIFVNGVEQSIGFRYTTSDRDLRNVVCFDEKQPVDAVVTIANQYQVYQATQKGWADANFASGIFMRVDGRVVNEFSVAERPALAMSNIRFPDYNDRNAHKAGADLAKTAVDAANTALLALEGEGDEGDQRLVGFTKENVIATLYAIEKFLSQIYPEARRVAQLDDNGIVVTDNNGNIVYEDFKVPDFRVVLLSGGSAFSDEGLTSFGTYRGLYGDSTDIGSFGSETNGIGVGLPPEGSGSDPSSGGDGAGLGGDSDG